MQSLTFFAGPPGPAFFFSIPLSSPMQLVSLLGPDEEPASLPHSELSTSHLPALASEEERSSSRSSALWAREREREREREERERERETRRTNLGLRLYAGNTLALSTTIVMYKLAVTAGAALRFVIFIRCFSNMLVGLGACYLNSLSPLGHRRGGLLLRGLMGCAGIVLQAIASALLPTAIVAVMAIGLQPAATALAAFLILGEEISPSLALSLPLSIVGISLIIEPWKTLASNGDDTEHALSPLGLLAALGAPCAIGTSSGILRLIMSDRQGPREKAEVHMPP